MVEEELYQRAIAMPLEQKVDKAVALFRHYESAAKTWDMFEPWFHGCKSFGKDSGIIDYLAKRAGVDIRWYHSLTTLDAPELIHFGREYHPDTIIIKPKLPMLRQMVEKEGQGPPTRLARWCCEIYKEAHCHGQIKVFGVRAQESGNRKANWRLWTPHSRDKSWVLCPILYWTDEDVWTLTHNEHIPYCSVYDEVDENGNKLFRRMGCIGCPMAGKCGREKEFARWPRYEMAWKRHFDLFWQKWHNVPLLRPRWVSREGKYAFEPLPGDHEERRWVKKTERKEDGFWTLRRWYDLKGYETWEELWAWWMEDEAEDEGCQMGLF